jgi:hypothetical protein
MRGNKGALRLWTAFLGLNELKDLLSVIGTRSRSSAEITSQEPTSQD